MPLSRVMLGATSSSDGVCVCVWVWWDQSGETVGMRDPHIHTHAHTHCYLIHVGLLNLIVVHYITDSYPQQNSAGHWRTMKLTNKDAKAIFIVSQYTDDGNFLFSFKGLQLALWDHTVSQRLLYFFLVTLTGRPSLLSLLFHSDVKISSIIFRAETISFVTD